MATRELSNSGVPGDAVAELVKLYNGAAAKLKEIVLNPPGGTQASQDFRQARAAMLVHQIDQILLQLKRGSATWIGGNVPQAYLDGLKRAEAQAKAIGITDFAPTGSLSLIDQRAAAIFARDIARDMNKAADSMGATAKKALRQTAQRDIPESDLDKILAGGVITGNPRGAIRELRESLEAVNGGVVTITDKNGDPMQFDAGYYASLVVRTKTREATVSARHERLQSLGMDLVSIVGLVSKNFCSAYLGMVFSLSGKSSDYPSIDELPDGGPPFHPNCSKSTRPYVEELASDKEQDMADGVDDADKLLNVDATTAQRRYQDLQLYQDVKQNYASTADKLFGKSAA